MRLLWALVAAATLGFISTAIGAEPAPSPDQPIELDANPEPSSPRFTCEMTTVPLGPVVDAEWALIHFQRALWDPVDPRGLGSLKAELQFRINGEVYRFANQRTLAQFVKAPTLWCGVIRDPVSAHRFRPSTRSPEYYWRDGPYLFESDWTRAQFVADPKRYEVIRRM